MTVLEYLRYGGFRIFMIWWNWDIYDMVELGYLEYGGTRISRIWWNCDI